MINFHQLQSGDIIAWRKPQLLQGGNSGHIVVLHSILTYEAPWLRIKIIDATNHLHANDSRAETWSKSGIGTGEMLFKLDEKGRPLGYCWSARKQYYKEHPLIAAARLTQTAYGRQKN